MLTFAGLSVRADDRSARRVAPRRGVFRLAPTAAPLVRAVALCAALLALTAPAAAGFEVLTTKQNDTIAEDTVVLRLKGSIVPPLADELRTVASSLSPDTKRVLFDLDSPGGSLTEMEKIVAVIADIRRARRVDTLVRHGAMCASACVALFMQGERRTAGGSSVWLFHGVCFAHTNVPSISLTHRFIDILREAGADEDFLCRLVDEGYVTDAGKLWLSGYELVNVYHANIITQLLDPWRPEPPYSWPTGPMGPR
jgi:hypothetical protein